MIIPGNAKEAINVLQAHGYEAYFVGGCVRDSLMDIIPHDYDIATSAFPNETLSCFSDYTTFTQGIAHGTVSVVIDSEVIEITSFRIDGEYTDMRHPDTVLYSRNLYDDLCRRDFTVNAIAYSEKTGYVDYCGGISDIRKKIIRAVGNPEKRFREDALRILRALRFASTLGFEIEENTSVAMHQNKDLLSNISKERIYCEFTKLLCGKNVRKVLLEYSDIIAVFIPEILLSVGFEQNNIHHRYDVYEHTLAALEAVPPTPVLRWTVFFHDLGKPSCYFEDEKGGHFYGHHKISAQISRDVLKRLCASKKTIDTVALLVYHHDSVIPETFASVRRLLMKLGEENTMLLFSVNRADAMAQAVFQIEDRLKHIDTLENTAKTVIAQKNCFSLKDLSLNGFDLIALGVEKGPRIGKILSALLYEVIDGKIENEKGALTKRAAEMNISLKE